MGKAARPVFTALSLVLLVLGVFFIERIYTGITFLGLSVWIALNVYVWKVKWLGRFLLSYLIALVPFLMVNGVLTALPVVWYNNGENLAIRLGSIPIEDTMYMMLLLMMNVNIYEWLLSRRNKTAVRMASTNA